MDDGFKVNNGVGLATESFTEEEVDRLKFVLENKFDLLVSKNPRKTNSSINRFRLFISAKSRNKLHSLVMPYFIPEMLYKLRATFTFEFSIIITFFNNYLKKEKEVKDAFSRE